LNSTFDDGIVVVLEGPADAPLAATEETTTTGSAHVRNICNPKDPFMTISPEKPHGTPFA
jgi:hypothetical protein